MGRIGIGWLLGIIAAAALLIVLCGRALWNRRKDRWPW